MNFCSNLLEGKGHKSELRPNWVCVGIRQELEVPPQSEDEAKVSPKVSCYLGGGDKRIVSSRPSWAKLA